MSRPWCRRASPLPALLWALALSPGAWAAEDLAPARYEGRLEQGALAELGVAIDPAPEGKRIGRIVVLPRPIIAPEDPWPTLLNWVHVTTREHVIRRELLIQEGDRFDRARIEESERNLRYLAILATARILPVKSERAEEVDLVVITKDLWSIRFNSSYALVGTLLQYLYLRPTEQNLLGLDKRLSVDLELRLDTLALGQTYVDRRLWGSRWAFGERALARINRESGVLEGSSGILQLVRPLHSVEAQWGASVEGSWNVRPVRVYREAEVRQLSMPGGGTAPYTYAARELEAEALYLRSFGRAVKLDLTFGAGAYSRRYSPGAGEPLSLAQRTFLAEGFLPRTEDAAYLALGARAYKAQYRILHDLETFALSEDYQVGPSLSAVVRLANPAGLLGEPFADGYAWLRRRWLGTDQLLQLTGAAGVRYRAAPPQGAPSWVNQRMAAELVYASPPFKVARLVVRGSAEAYSNDLDRTMLFLGGGNGLRGSPPELMAGSRRVLLNVELRSRPIELRTLHLGAVLFYDAGAAFDEAPVPLHSVGLGLRALFPQFDIEPLRFDFGWVIAGPPMALEDRFSSSFGQVTRHRPALFDDRLGR
jgi:hypothetical protein